MWLGEEEDQSTDDRTPEYRRDESWARTQISIHEGQREAYLACQEGNTPQRSGKHSHQCRGCRERFICQIEGIECGLIEWDPKFQDRPICHKCYGKATA